MAQKSDRSVLPSRRSAFLVAGGAFAALGAMSTSPLWAAAEGVVIPPPDMDPAVDREHETAVIAGGCFWGVQGVFQHVAGVRNAVSGYAGGERATADYDAVSSGSTGHAESVRIVFDPRVISYGRILQIYFSVAHDPTQLNFQGPDVGTQYRSTIFPENSEQAALARAYIAQLDRARIYRAPIVTTLEPGKAFYPAEGYHQDFMTRNPDYPYIVFHDLPKLAALKKLFPDRYRADPVLVASAGAAQ